MAYQNDGKSHHEGVKFEETALNWLKFNYSKNIDLLKLDLKKVTSIKFTSKGGTQNKADILVEFKNLFVNTLEQKTISVKKKTFDGNKIHGTFDLINTSKIDIYDDYFDIKTLKKFIFDYVNEYESSIDKDQTFIKYSKRYPIVASESFKNTSPKKLVSLANDFITETDYLIIGLTKEKVVSEYFIGNTADLKFPTSIDFNLRKGRGDFSRKIFMNDHGVEKPTPFRIRLVLNNGINAVVGRGGPEKNQTSVWTFKIQVDDVNFYLNKMLNYKIQSI